MSNGKYAQQNGFGAILRQLERSKERAANSNSNSATSPVLFVSTLADGPPTDGSVFWYVTDETC